MSSLSTSRPPKVVISYSWDSPQHRDRVLELANRLRSDGIDCEVDQYNASPPEGWPLWMERQIDEADFVLMVCTETYHARVTGQEDRGVGRGVVWESKIIFNQLFHQSAPPSKYVPVLFFDGGPETIPAPLLPHSYYYADTEDGYRALYRHLAKESPTSSAEQPLPRRPRFDRFALWNVPFGRNPYFTGREEEIESLYDLLFGGQVRDSTVVAVIHGLGGIGKTQLAVEYVHRNRKAYEAIFWVHAETAADIKSSLLEIGETLQLPEIKKSKGCNPSSAGVLALACLSLSRRASRKRGLML